MNAQLEHANITVRNLDNAVHFLSVACPNFKVRGEGVNNGQRWLHIGTESTYLALSEDVSVNTDREMYADGGLNHIGFVIDDAKTLRKRLSEAGYREGFRPTAHPHRERVYFLDKDGLEWEFVQYFSEDPAKRNDYTL
jgi:catechol 2,3-dioxygenase-like lactoylglutathione lyase family enzyme